MKKVKLSIVIAMIASIGLTGCDNSSNSNTSRSNETVTKVSDIQNQTNEQLSAEQSELSQYLEKMKAQDPTIKDMYYSYDENGEKMLHVVRDTSQQNSTDTSTNPNSNTTQTSSHLEDFMWGMAGGATAALLFSAFSKGGFSGMNRSYAPAYRNTYTPQQYMDKKYSNTSNYKNSVMNLNRNSATLGTKLNPNRINPSTRYQPVTTPAQNSNVYRQGYNNPSYNNTNRTQYNNTNRIDTTRKLTPVTPSQKTSNVYRPSYKASPSRSIFGSRKR